MTVPNPTVPAAGDEPLSPSPRQVGPIAYFSMEIGLDPAYPTYSGGLGVLAGDTLWSAADLGVPVIGVTLAHRKGYFRQQLDAEGEQTESDDAWSPEEALVAIDPIESVEIEGRRVYLRAWMREIRGCRGAVIPVYFLDTNLPENAEEDRAITDHLYGGDDRYRLAQEIVLGIGGVKMLRALGYDDLHFHMNEGHSALLTLALVEEELRGHECPERPATLIEHTRRRCVFTTHTPVPAGHDQFPEGLVVALLGERRAQSLRRLGYLEGHLNMTDLGMHLSRYVNGVAMRHAEVSRGMFPDQPIDAITNGVHAARWTSPAMAALYDRHLPEWRFDNAYLRYALHVPIEEIRSGHLEAKRDLLATVRETTGVTLDQERLTIGFARRAAQYKRPDLLFRDLARLRAIAARHPFQVVYGGKAHPQDDGGKALIRAVFGAARDLRSEIPVVYLPNYGMELASKICAGVDLWLNTPTKPHEASGTSGMKAAMNGVPSLSVLDGWWIEGHFEGTTGWSIGGAPRDASDDAAEATSLYDKLEKEILPLFYGSPQGYGDVMRAAIAINGSFFSTQRMVAQYVRHAYSGNGNRSAPAS